MSQPRRLPQILLLIETSRAYGRGLVEGIAHYAEQHGSWCMYFEERGLTDPLPRWFRDWRGDGIISRTTRKANIAKLLAKRLPVVELYADTKRKLPQVFPDEGMIARMAADHFLDRGLRHFGFFCSLRAHWVDQRRHAFETLLHDRGYACDSFRPVAAPRPAGKKRRPLDDRSVTGWLRELPKPCGVLCASDFYAMCLAEACRTCGIVAPEQIALLGVDNDPVFCGVCLPRLSSIDLGIARIGYEAAALLDRLMGGQSPPEEIVSVAPRHVVTRQSTDMLAVEDADMSRAARFIREQACRDRQLQVGQAAAAVGLSLRAFEQRFRRAFHRRPKEEILRVRMERAKMLLSDSDMAVALVARNCGFASLEYFSRAFQRQTGTTPREYRKQRRLPLGSSHL